MDNNQKSQFSLKLIQKCPVCNHEYTEGRIDILSETDGGFLAYLTCGYCFSNIIVKVVTMPHGLIGNAILTDLSATEVLDFSDYETINSDNVLTVHQMIRKNQDFISQLK